MSINIKPIIVNDLTTGEIIVNGKLPQSYINLIASSTLAVNNSLVENQYVNGTPSSIVSQVGNPSYNLAGNAHMGVYNVLLSTNIIKNISQEEVYIPEKIVRIVKIGGLASWNNTLLYSINPKQTTDPTTVRLNILFPNVNAQENGDYLDITISTNWAYNYFSILIIPNGYINKIVLDISRKQITFPSDSEYYCLNPDYSTIYLDKGTSHTINIRGYNNISGILPHLVICIEDWAYVQSDKDYNDVILLISSPSIINSNINDTLLS